MPLFFRKDIDEKTALAIWQITEDEAFFLEQVPLQRSITHPHKRLQHLAGRYLLAYLAPRFPLSLIRIADTRKPYLDNEAYHFSLSHCGDFAAAIVSTTARVGIDIELASSKVERISPKFMSGEERSLLTSLKKVQPLNSSPSTVNYQLSTLLWSCKEAIFKWYSLGEMDFKEHMQAQSISVKKEDITTDFLFNKNAASVIKLHSRFFGNLCLSYIIT